MGVEWEDIRYELVNGVERYLYTMYGKSLGIKSEVGGGNEDEGISEVGGEDGGSGSGGGDGSGGEFGIEYLPMYDFNKVNEKNCFILQLITFVNDWFVRRLHEKMVVNRMVKDDRITFHLE